MRRLFSIATLVVACSLTENVSCEPPGGAVETFKEAIFKPDLKGTESPGIVVSNIRKESFPECLGLADGDRVIEYNGHPIHNVPSFVEFMREFMRAAPLRIRVEDSSGRVRTVVNTPPAA